MLDVTTFQPALKQRYPDYEIENLVYRRRPLLAMLPKDEGFGGDVMKMPIIIGNPQNRSATFARANNITSQTNVKAFLLTRVSNYSIAEISNEVMLASEGDSNAFMRAASTEINGALDALGRDLSISAYRSGRGDIGQIGAGTVLTGNVIQLADAESVVNFEVGMKLVAAVANTGTITVKNSSGTENVLTITAIDRTATPATLTMSANLDSFAAQDWAAADYLFVQGDVAATSVLKMSGLDAWLPYANRSSLLAASFFGVTRSEDSSRLGGVIHDGTNQPIEEALIDLASKIGREGGAPDYGFIGFKKYSNLVKSLGSKVQYVNIKAGEKGTIGFEGIQVNGPRGTITIMPDGDCPDNRGYLLQMDTWKLASLKKAVNLFDGDGLQMLRSGTNDSLQLRCFSYAQLGCTAPGWNGVVALPSS